MASEKSARAKATASNRSDSCLGSIWLIISRMKPITSVSASGMWGLGLCCLPAPVGVHEQAMQGVLRVLVAHRPNLFAAVAPSSQLMATFPSACAVLRCLARNCAAREDKLSQPSQVSTLAAPSC
jgi:hypothetical protein